MKNPVQISATITERPAQPYVGNPHRHHDQHRGDRRPASGDPQRAARARSGAGRAALPAVPGDPRRHVRARCRGGPVAAPIDPATGSTGVHAGELPGGKYVTVTHHGHPGGLLDVTAGLLAWPKERGLVWDATPDGDGRRWACRLESYLTDPRVEPDPNSWDTELAIRLAD